MEGAGIFSKLINSKNFDKLEKPIKTKEHKNKRKTNHFKNCVYQREDLLSSLNLQYIKTIGID